MDTTTSSTRATGTGLPDLPMHVQRFPDTPLTGVGGAPSPRHFLYFRDASSDTAPSATVAVDPTTARRSAEGDTVEGYAPIFPHPNSGVGWGTLRKAELQRENLLSLETAWADHSRLAERMENDFLTDAMRTALDAGRRIAYEQRLEADARFPMRRGFWRYYTTDTDAAEGERVRCYVLCLTQKGWTFRAVPTAQHRLEQVSGTALWFFGSGATGAPLRFRVFHLPARSKGDGTIPLAVWPEGEQAPHRVQHMQTADARAYLGSMIPLSFLGLAPDADGLAYSEGACRGVAY